MPSAQLRLSPKTTLQKLKELWATAGITQGRPFPGLAKLSEE